MSLDPNGRTYYCDFCGERALLRRYNDDGTRTDVCVECDIQHERNGAYVIKN